MSETAFGPFTGRTLQPSASEWSFGQRTYNALPEFIAWCREQGFEELTEDELDFSGRKKIVDKRDGSYWRCYRAKIEESAAFGVSAFCVRGGLLYLLHRPGSEKVESETIGTNLRGRKARPDEPPAGWHKVDRVPSS